MIRVGRRVPRGAFALLLSVALAALALGRAHGAKGGSALDQLATLKVHQWVQMEGIFAGDSTAGCDELQLLTGDFLDDDWTLKGYIESVDPARREFSIAGIRLRVTENTGFESPKRTFRDLADLHRGQLVEVEGTYLKNRRFLAMEVDDESNEPNEPWRPNLVQAVGKVERVDLRRRLVWVMGFAFHVTDKTRMRSVIE